LLLASFNTRKIQFQRIFVILKSLDWGATSILGFGIGKNGLNSGSQDPGIAVPKYNIDRQRKITKSTYPSCLHIQVWRYDTLHRFRYIDPSIAAGGSHLQLQRYIIAR